MLLLSYKIMPSYIFRGVAIRKFLILFVLTICILGLITPVLAYTEGEPIGQVLHSNIIAYIDGYPIKSFNINGYTYVVAEDLLQYGFNVEWIHDGNKLVIHTERSSSPSDYIATYIPKESRYPSGTPAMQYLYTNITTWIDNTQIIGYNIGGYTCVNMDDLADTFAVSYVWNDSDRSLRMATTDWKHDYNTPNYDPLKTITGEYAIWNFTKNSLGEFELVDSKGTIDFIPYLQFGATQMSYKIMHTQKQPTSDGSTTYSHAPHNLTAHNQVQSEFFVKHSPNVLYLPGTTNMVVPDMFFQYCSTEKNKADYLRKNCPLLRQTLRVYYDDEPVDLIGFIDGTSRLQSYRPKLDSTVFYLQYSKFYPLKDVSNVRVEFKLPQ